MTTTDDLVVSLTIKPTSNLGKLQRQLEAIVGADGKGAGSVLMKMKGDVKKIRKDTTNIKSWIKYLRPTHLPSASDPSGQRISGVRQASDMRKKIDALADRFTRQRGVKGFKASIGVTTDEELKEFFKKGIKSFIITSEKIAKGESEMSPAETEKFQKAIDEALSNILTKRDIGKGLWTGIVSSMPENVFRDTLFAAFKAAGINITAESPFWTKVSEQTKKPSRMDLMAKDDAMEVLKLLGAGDDIKNMIDGSEGLAMELKMSQGLTEQFIKQVEKQVSFFGKENIVFLLRDIRGQLAPFFEKKGLAHLVIPSPEDILTKATGKEWKALTEDKGKKIMKESFKENNEKKLDDIIKVIRGLSTTEESRIETEKILEELRKALESGSSKRETAMGDFE